MNFITLVPSLQQPKLNQKKVYCTAKTVLGAFMIVSFLVFMEVVKLVGSGSSNNMERQLEIL